MKPSLEELTERILPSASALTIPPVADATSQMVATIEQWSPVLVTWENELSQIEQAILQKFAQELVVVQQQWTHLLGIDTTSTNPSNNAVVPPPTSNSGSSNSSSSTNLGPVASQNGGAVADSASSNISRTTTHYAANTLALPLTSSTASSSGSVSPDFGGEAYGTVSGQVWLDNNGNGSQETNEVGLSGITVYLNVPGGQQGQGLSTTTDVNGNYEFQLEKSLYNLPNQFQIQVVLPSGDYGTIEGTRSNINTSGYSDVFTLNPNTGVQRNAGLRSMVVTTAQDDPNVAIPKQITLRDAIQTGNNGPPASAITFAPGVTGVISLQKVLDPIKTSYNIVGPGAATIAVQGNGTAQNPYGIFELNAGVTSTIRAVPLRMPYEIECLE